MKKRGVIITIVSIGCALALAFLIVCIVAFASFMRGDYNSVMRKYLSDENNYKTLQVICSEAFYYDSSNKVTVDGTSKLPERDYLIVYVKASYRDSDGKTGNIILEIIKENAQALIDNGFFEKIAAGEEITVRSTVWIYMDNEFNFVASAQTADCAYLDFDKGLNNIKAHMQRHSMF